MKNTNKMLITVVEVDENKLFAGAKVKHKKTGKIREIYVLPDNMRISEAVNGGLFDMDKQVEYETVMLNKHLFELVEE